MQFKLGQKIIDKIRGKNKNKNIVHYPEPSDDTFNQLCHLADTILGKNNIKTIFEFGSRYGEDTIAFAKKYPNAKIYSYECNPNTCKECQNNISKYNNIIFDNKAISDIAQTLKFYSINKEQTTTTWADGNQGASSLLKASGKYTIEDYHQDCVEVEATTLLNEMNKYNINTIDLIWIDVQGAELSVLKGLGERIKDVKIFQIETEYMEMYTNQPLFDEILDLLENNNFIYLGNTAESTYSADAIFVNANEIDLAKLNLLDKTVFANVPKSINKLLVANDLNFYSLKNTKDNSVETSIDVIIPTCLKDIAKLELVINSIKKNVLHKIDNIYVVTSPDLCETYSNFFEENCKVINEEHILPLKKDDIKYYPRNINRTGWIYQQLIKLNADNISSADNILIADSDTIFVKPQKFIEDDKFVLDCSDEYHLPYMEPLRKMGMYKRFDLSFIAHHMIFNRKYLQELKKEIELFTNTSWINAIIKSLNLNEISSFSEYELYGNYLYFNHIDKIKLKYWYNLSTTKKEYEKIDKKIINLYKTVSLHSYNELINENN